MLSLCRQMSGAHNATNGQVEKRIKHNNQRKSKAGGPRGLQALIARIKQCSTKAQERMALVATHQWPVKNACRRHDSA